MTEEDLSTLSIGNRVFVVSDSNYPREGMYLGMANGRLSVGVWGDGEWPFRANYPLERVFRSEHEAIQAGIQILSEKTIPNLKGGLERLNERIEGSYRQIDKLRTRLKEIEEGRLNLERLGEFIETFRKEKQDND